MVLTMNNRMILMKVAAVLFLIQVFSISSVFGLSNQFNNTYSDRGLDTDGDGFFDYIAIDVGVNVSKAGYYYVNGNLYNGSGWYIDSTSNYTNLNSGNQTVQLRFRGAQIWQYRMSGTFNLSYLYLYNSTSWEQFDYRYYAYTTNSYNYTDFRPQAILMPGIRDYGIDEDNNGLYDYLVIEKQVNVTTAGDYELDGYLYNPSGYYIGYAYNYTTLNSGVQNITLRFNGVQIYKSNSTGNFTLHTNLYGYSSSDLSASTVQQAKEKLVMPKMEETEEINTSSHDLKPLAISLKQLANTSIWQWFDSATDLTGYYSYTQFERLPARFSDAYSDYGLDTDGNGFYDYIVINVGVNVSKAGNYQVSGSLYNGSGWYINWTDNSAYLDAGNQTVQLRFNGAKIWQYRMNGTFDLKYLYLYNASDGSQFDYRYYASYTTGPYNYTDFRPAAQFNDVYSDRALDTDGNGLSDYIAIDVGVNVSKAGYYQVSGELYNNFGWYINQTSNSTYLDAGNQTVQLQFSGAQIWQYRMNGAFDLRYLGLYNASDGRELDYRYYAYTTMSYNYMDFGPGVFDTGAGSYPSIMGMHNGTLRLDQSINVSRMYTYSSAGTGGHSEYAAFYYPNGTLLASGSWSGSRSDWHNITFAPFTLEAGVTYNYTIRTGSYPQVIHNNILNNTIGTITSTEFIDANGRRYSGWIPAIRLE